MSEQWYFEDFAPGQEIDLGQRLVTEEEIIDFATRFDPQPFHIDKEAAARSIYGGVIASGWHTCAMMMRMVVDGMRFEEASMGSPGLDGVRWHQPVRAGDTLSLRYITKPSRHQARSRTAASSGRPGSPPTSAARRCARSRGWR